MISLKGVSKYYGEGEQAVHALKGVDLHINQGEIFGIIGFSGAGKSTLVRCINLLERPSSGEVVVDGKAMGGLSESELREARKDIGFIFQHFNLFPSRSVFENVAYPLKHSGLSKKEKAQRVHELLELVGIGDKEQAFPAQLSGGQKQRVAIARALANHPKVLLCDEATSALDPQTTESILKLLARLNKELNLTIVIITHQMEVVKSICDRVAVMEHGAVVEQGSVYEVFSHPQAALTKDFIASTSSLSKIYELVDEKSALTNLKPGERIIRFDYRNNVNEAVISEISRRFLVDVSIIFADIDIIQNKALGSTIAILSGQPSDIDAAIAYLHDHKVDIEVIAHAAA